MSLTMLISDSWSIWTVCGIWPDHFPSFYTHLYSNGLGLFQIFNYLFGILINAESMLLNGNFILFLTLFVIFISLGSYGLGMNLRDKQKKKLERLVLERTEALEKANAELQHRNDELDRFVYSASHDLSAPLKSILGLINVARLENPKSEQAQYLVMMEKSVMKLEWFIEEVIQYSRNARMPVKLEEINFKQLVSDILNDYQYDPSFKNINVTVETLDEPKLITDIMRLKIILNNLISNAIKFHRLEDGMTPEIKISLQTRDDRYVLTVQDNGRGIQPVYLDKIFDMFFRATEEVPGSGLGLYILKETVMRLNGTIDVKSEFGSGTTFTISVPKQ